jgi:hypothetical protein
VDTVVMPVLKISVRRFLEVAAFCDLKVVAIKPRARE